MAPNTIPSEEITKQTCPACRGKGRLEHRAETATGYVVTAKDCFVCEALGMVSADRYAWFAKFADFFEPYLKGEA